MKSRNFIPRCSTDNNPAEKLDDKLGEDVIKVNLPKGDDNANAILIVWGQVFEHGHTNDSELYTFFGFNQDGNLTVDSDMESTIVGPNSPKNIATHSIPKSSNDVQIIHARKRGTNEDAWNDYLSDPKSYVNNLNISGTKNMKVSLPSYGSIHLEVDGTTISCSPESRSVYVKTQDGKQYFCALPTQRDQDEICRS